MQQVIIDDCSYYIYDCDIDMALLDKYRNNWVTKDSKTYYCNVPMAFDIETTSCIIDGNKSSYMYIWQFCIDDIVIMGRSWNDYKKFIYRLSSYFCNYNCVCDSIISNDNIDKVLVVYVHYLPFEFQYLRSFFTFGHIFAREPREVITARSDNIEYRCSYKLTNMGLREAIANVPGARFNKLSGKDFDYTVLRYSDTVLSNLELAYCYCDVRGLCEVIANLLLDDNLATIPMTRTGYVRRKCRERVLSNPRNNKLIQDTRLSPYLYALAKTARRGGNTHCNHIYSGEIIDNVKSRDRQSSYPHVNMAYKYPMGRFTRVKDKRRLDYYCNKYACLIDITFYDCRLIQPLTVPYVSKSKCTMICGAMVDNGRIFACDSMSMVITDIDYNIIVSTYSIDSYAVRSLYVTEYDYLPRELRLNILEDYYRKTTLKGVDDYYYTKSKNDLNSNFGMMLTDICSDTIDYIDNNYVRQECNITKALHQYYNSKSSFLAYQWGVWTTAHARNELQKVINHLGSDLIYCDTDSVYYVGNYDNYFDNLNNSIINDNNKLDIVPNINYNGKDYQMGVWETQKCTPYRKFISLGAKKYCYIDNKDVLHITVSGLNKSDGAKWLLEHGGINNFKIGVTVPPDSSGRTSSTYIDDLTIKNIVFNGHAVTVASGVHVSNVAYTFGLSEDYGMFLDWSRLEFNDLR